LNVDVPLTLFDDDPEQNDRLIGIPNARDRLKQDISVNRPTPDRPLLIRVHLQNFWKLTQVVKRAADWIGISIPDRAPLTVDDPERLPELLREHIDQLKSDLAGGVLAIDDSDPVPMTVLGDIAARAKARPEERTHLLRLLGILADAAFAGPLTFHLDLSNVCNTDCIFCGLHSPLLRPGDEIEHGRRLTPDWESARLDAALFDSLIDDLADSGSGEDLLFTGEGEPLTHPDFARMVTAAKQRDLHLTVFTNGLLLNEEMSRLLVDRGVDLLYWSLSAGSSETFRLVQPSQPVNAFERTVGRVRRMIGMRDSQGLSKPRIVMAHVLIRQNAGDCMKVFRLARDLGVEMVRFQLAHSCGPGFDELLLRQDELKPAQEQIAMVQELAAQEGITILSNIDLQMQAAGRNLEQGHTSDKWSSELIGESGCLAGWFFSRAFSDGTLSLCCHDRIVGDLNSNDFNEIWFSEHMRRIRRAARLADPEHDNPDLSRGDVGGPLFGPDCRTCGNYEVISRAMNDLKSMGFWPIVLREREEFREFNKLKQTDTV